MHYTQISGLPIIEENEAEGELLELFTQSKIVLEMPYVPNLAKAMTANPNVLQGTIDIYRAFYRNITLPQSLIAMIAYCIPTAKNCTYCAANGELFCRTIGIDEKTLDMLAHNLGSVSPLRVKAILQFTLKCALEPHGLVAEDYDAVREMGVSDEEIVELIFIAAVANFSDTLADALKLEVEQELAQALGR